MEAAGGDAVAEGARPAGVGKSAGEGMRLFELLELKAGRDRVVSIAGSGGKTSLLYLLAREAAESGLRVAASTTTHIGRPTPDVWLEEILDEGSPLVLEARLAACFNAGRVAVCGRPADGMPEKLGRPEQLRLLLREAELLLLEADGSRRLPLKLPRAGEPVILPESDRVFVVAGLSACGRPLADCCQRFALARERLGLAQDEPASPESIARLLLAGYGDLHPYFLLNQADEPDDQTAGRRIAELLKAAGAAEVALLSIRRGIFEKEGVMTCWF